jgi:hypothetical protein
VLIADGQRISYRNCAVYLHAIQRSGWFMAAFLAIRI